MNVEQCIADQIRASISTKQAILSDKGLMRNIAAAAQMIVDAYEQGKKTLLAGNGGSAADAQHIAGEFVSKFYFDRPGIASIALTTDTSIITAIGNDYGYDKFVKYKLRDLPETCSSAFRHPEIRQISWRLCACAGKKE